MYLLRLALRPWKKSAVVQVLSALSFSFVIFLISVFWWMDRELKPLVTKLKTDQVLTVYLNADTTENDENRIIDSIRMNVGSAPEVKLVPSDRFLSEMKRHYPELVDEIYQLGPEMKMTVPKYVSVSGTLKSQVISSIKAITGVDSIDMSYNKLRQAAGPFQALRLFSKFMIFGLLIAGICGIVLLGRSVHSQMKETLSLMELMGASQFERKIPSILSGVSVGVVGGVLSCGFWLAFAPRIISGLREFSPALSGLPEPSLWIGIALLLISAIMGMAVVVMGSDH